MALLVPDQGEVIVLRAALSAEDLDLRLYKNNKTPAAADTEGAYVEADFIGYAAIPLDFAMWTFANREAVQPQQQFVSSAGAQNQNVYGYYVTQRSSGKLMWAEKFTGPDTPFQIQNNLDDIKVTAKFHTRREA